ncbi:hypothetical protein [Desulfospira joergensenii]|uniref:hypothetical protein n=1 Tax=Desulfospira joergensenii TaxID=53329 RepID=UPI0003B4D453|nr:hypothetical protein [Desulfospira joergensenii]
MTQSQIEINCKRKPRIRKTAPMRTFEVGRFFNIGSYGLGLKTRFSFDSPCGDILIGKEQKNKIDTPTKFKVNPTVLRNLGEIKNISIGHGFIFYVHDTMNSKILHRSLFLRGSISNGHQSLPSLYLEIFYDSLVLNISSACQLGYLLCSINSFACIVSFLFGNINGVLMMGGFLSSPPPEKVKAPKNIETNGPGVGKPPGPAIRAPFR